MSEAQTADKTAENTADDKEELVDIEVEAEDEAQGEADPAGAQAEAADGAKADATDKSAADDDGEDEEDDDEEDERLSADQREDEGAKKTRRQRAKERRRQAIEQNRIALQEARMQAARADLNARKLQVEFAAFRAQQEAAQIDAQAAQLQGEYQRQMRIKADALSKGDGQRAANADHQIMQIQHRYTELGQAKTRASQSLQGIGEAMRQIEAYEKQLTEGMAAGGAVVPPGQGQQATQAQAEPAAPVLNSDGQRMAKEFMESLPWYRQGTKAGDSAIVDTIDVVLIRDGFDPNSKDYWDEFRTRLKAALPERFKAPKNPAPPVGAGRETMSANKTKMRIPREAMETMRLAGIIDDANKVTDRKKFDAYLSRYKKNAQAQRRAS